MLSLLTVLDMARHVPLYRALLELLRAIASCTSMVPLLLPLSTENGEEEEEQSECQTSVGTLLAKMKTCVDTYTNRLRSKRENVKTGVKPDASDQEPEGLTLLVPDIQKTAEIVHAATTSLRQANQGIALPLLCCFSLDPEMFRLLLKTPFLFLLC